MTDSQLQSIKATINNLGSRLDKEWMGLHLMVFVIMMNTCSVPTVAT